jgi:hypothetical protein
MHTNNDNNNDNNNNNNNNNNVIRKNKNKNKKKLLIKYNNDINNNNIIKNNNIVSDIYIILRPDLIYINNIDMNELNQCMLKRNVMLPFWGQNGGYNDKIAIVHKDCIEKYLNINNWNSLIYDQKNY